VGVSADGISAPNNLVCGVQSPTVQARSPLVHWKVERENKYLNCLAFRHWEKPGVGLRMLALLLGNFRLRFDNSKRQGSLGQLMFHNIDYLIFGCSRGRFQFQMQRRQ